MTDFGADRALALRVKPASGLAASRIDHGEDAWVEALCIFYEHDCMPQKAWNIRHGAPLDNLDRRAIDALKAAFEKVAA
jgi:hypothetical protein